MCGRPAARAQRGGTLTPDEEGTEPLHKREGIRQPHAVPFLS